MIVLSWGVVQGCFRKAQWVLLTKKRCRKWRRIFWFFFLNVRFYSTTHDMKGLGNQVTKIVSFPRESFKFINERHFLKNGAINDQMSSLACVCLCNVHVCVCICVCLSECVSLSLVIAAPLTR